MKIKWPWKKESPTKSEAETTSSSFRSQLYTITIYDDESRQLREYKDCTRVNASPYNVGFFDQIGMQVVICGFAYKVEEQV